MIHLRRWAFIVVGTFAPASAIANPTFKDAPISCGSMIQFRDCTAAFDGQTLRLTYMPSEGRPSHAVYKYCTVTPMIIHCPAGQWQSEMGTLPLGARSLGLKNNKPYSD